MDMNLVRLPLPIARCGTRPFLKFAAITAGEVWRPPAIQLKYMPLADVVEGQQLEWPHYQDWRLIRSSRFDPLQPLNPGKYSSHAITRLLGLGPTHSPQHRPRSESFCRKCLLSSYLRVIDVVTARVRKERKAIMRTFTIDEQNNITAFATQEEAAAAGGLWFTSRKELAKLSAEWLSADSSKSGMASRE